MDPKKLKEVSIIVLIVILIVLTLFILKPIAKAILIGLLGAYVLYPVHKRLLKKIKSPNLSALIICLAIFVVILLPLWLLTPLVIKQAFNIYITMQNTDLVSLFTSHFPSFFGSQELSVNLISSINGFIGKVISNLLSNFTQIIINLPALILQFFIVVFTFFFTLRDGKGLIEYLKSFSPLSKESQKRFFERFKDITNSVLLGQVVVGIAQGLVTGIGLFIFQVPNALILTIIAVLVGVIPIIGPWLVWIPAGIYLLASGRSGAAIGLLIYGLIVVTWIDSIIRPAIVSRKTKINSGIIFIGMIGGLFTFGIIGLLLGPLILSYLLLALELYKQKKSNNILISSETSPQNS